MIISPHAVVHPDAHIESGVTIDAFAIVEADVTIKSGTRIYPHAMVMNGTSIGQNCEIYPGAILGGDPQDLKYKGESTTLEIGDHVTVREYCTINRGTAASDRTEIKSHALIMAYTHIAHDCVIGEHAVVSNGVNMAGHVIVDNQAIIGGMTAVQQFVRIGRNTYIGGGSLVRKDVPPFVKVAREPLAFSGVNTIGLKRKLFDGDTIERIAEIYRILFIKNSNISIGIFEVKSELPESLEKSEIVTFVEQSTNGLIKGYRNDIDDAD